MTPLLADSKIIHMYKQLQYVQTVAVTFMKMTLKTTLAISDKSYVHTYVCTVRIKLETADVTTENVIQQQLCSVCELQQSTTFMTQLSTVTESHTNNSLLLAICDSSYNYARIQNVNLTHPMYVPLTGMRTPHAIL